MFKTNHYTQGFLIVALTLLIGVGIVSANFVRTTDHGGTLSRETFKYGYGYGYSLGYGYGYGYARGSAKEITFGPIYGFKGADGSATVTNVTDTQTSFTVNFSTTYTTTGTALYSPSHVFDSATETSDQSGARSLSITGLTCATTYAYTLSATDKGDNTWSTSGTTTTSSCATSGGGGGGTAGGWADGFKPFDPTLIPSVPQMWNGYTLPHRILRPGTYNFSVIDLQKILNQLGFTVSEKGVGSKGHEYRFYGKNTKNAVKRFQKAYGLKPDGFYGPLTEAVMKSLMK